MDILTPVVHLPVTPPAACQIPSVQCREQVDGVAVAAGVHWRPPGAPWLRVGPIEEEVHRAQVTVVAQREEAPGVGVEGLGHNSIGYNPAK